MLWVRGQELVCRERRETVVHALHAQSLRACLVR